MIGRQQTLMVTQEVPISCHSIGIRAHDFTTEPQQPIKSKCITYKHCQHLLNKVLGFNTNKPKFGGKANRLNPKVITQLSIPPTAIMPLCL